MLPTWIRSHPYSQLRSKDSDTPPYKATSRWAAWMGSRRIRIVVLFSLVVSFLITISSLTDVPSRVHDLPPQDLGSSFKDNGPPSDIQSKQPQLFSPPKSKSAISSQPSPTAKTNDDSGRPKETGNEPASSGEHKPAATPEGPNPKPGTNQSAATGNEPSINGQHHEDEPKHLKIDKPINLQELEISQSQQNQTQFDGVDWPSFAYVQYVTNINYLCNSLMILEALHRLGTKAERIMMYPEEWKIPGTDEVTTEEARLLLQAKEMYKARLVPIKVVTFEDRGDETWKDSYTKLLAFNQTQYKRVISLDSDAVVRQHMDELFFLPSTPLAMPRAYWLAQPFLSSQLLVIEPSTAEWTRIERYMASNPNGGFDMDILNTLYKDSALILPHRRYDMLTSEFRKEPNNHEAYLGTNEKWNGTKALEEAKLVHFSDWPLKKPWLNDEEGLREGTPGCLKVEEMVDCTDRDIWLGFYRGYSAKRKEVCGRPYDDRRRSTILERRASRKSSPAWFEAVVRC